MGVAQAVLDLMTIFLHQSLQCWNSRCEPSQPSSPVPFFTLSLCVDSVTPGQPPSQCFSVSLQPSPTLSIPVSVSLLLYLDLSVPFPVSLCLQFPFCTPLPISVFMPVSCLCCPTTPPCWSPDVLIWAESGAGEDAS